MRGKFETISRVLLPSYPDVLAPAATVAPLRPGPARRHPLVAILLMILWGIGTLPLALAAEEFHLNLDHEEVIYSRELTRINQLIKPAHLLILGMKLGEPTQQAIESKLGQTKGYINKGGHHALLQICYAPDLPGDGTKVIFGIDNYDMKVVSFMILSSKFKLHNSEKCKNSPLISRDIGTGSGLKLGVTMDHVKAILDVTPSKETKDRLIYSYDFKRPFTKQEIEEHRRNKSSCVDEYIYSRVDTKFLNSQLISLQVIQGGEAGDSCYRNFEGKQ